MVIKIRGEAIKINSDGKQLFINVLKRLFPNIETVIMRLISSWLTAVFMIYLFAQQNIMTKEFPLSVNIGYAALSFVCAFIVISTAAALLKNICKIDSGWLLFISAALIIMLSCGKLDMFGCIAAMPFVLAAVFFTLFKDKLRLPKWSKKLWPAVIISGAAIMFIFSGIFIALRYYNMSAPAYDFGIFSQMFENMKNGFLPYTTVERGYELSHFAVHFSPAYYLMLPFYMIYPHPMTLELLQGAIVTSGVIPVYLIARKYELSKPTCALIGLIYCFYPALTGGCRYDLHENCMLAPLLLWLFWAIERERFIPIVIFSLLTLAVKEDAAIYVCTVALYLIFCDRGKKMKITGGIMLVCGIAYFIAVCAFLDSQGLGIMSWRYDNYIYDPNGGLFNVIISVIVNPGYVISNLLDESKLMFVLQMLLPLGFIPLFCKKFSRVILFIPFILINLMPNYAYQHDINFQYVFGTAAIFIWLFIQNCADMRYHSRRTAVVFCLAASVSIFCCCHWKLTDNLSINPDDQAAISYLEQLDTDLGSVTADTFFVPALYKQKELYSITTANIPDERSAPLADVVLLDKRFEAYQTEREYYLSHGMTETFVEGTAGNIICRLDKS